MHTLYIYNSTFFHNPFVSWDKINLHSALLASGGSDIIFKWNAGKSGGGEAQNAGQADDHKVNGTRGQPRGAPAANNVILKGREEMWEAKT